MTQKIKIAVLEHCFFSHGGVLHSLNPSTSFTSLNEVSKPVLARLQIQWRTKASGLCHDIFVIQRILEFLFNVPYLPQGRL
jgi:hypothetical protein